MVALGRTPSHCTRTPCSSYAQLYVFKALHKNKKITKRIRDRFARCNTRGKTLFPDDSRACNALFKTVATYTKANRLPLSIALEGGMMKSGDRPNVLLCDCANLLSNRQWTPWMYGAGVTFASAGVCRRQGVPGNT